MYFLVPQHTIKFTFFGNKANFVGGGIALLGVFHISSDLFL